MKRKILLLSVLAICFTFTKAQELVPVWEDDIMTLPRSIALAANNDLIAISATNEVYITGIFNGEFDFGNSTLESEFNSTYLAKYNADGSKAWAVGFIGYVTPTAITVSEDGNIYVAGTLADQVELESTDNNTLVIDGVINNETYELYQSAAFIAQYNSQGELQKASSYKPAIFPNLSATGYNRDGARIHIYKLQHHSNNLIAALKIAGTYSNGDIEITGSYSSLDFGEGMVFPLLDVTSGYVVSFDENLSLSNIYSELSIADGKEINYNVNTVSFAISENNLFAAFSASGEMELNVNNQLQDVNFDSQDVQGEKYLSRGAIIANINLADISLNGFGKFDNVPVENGHAAFFEINDIYISGNSLLISGAFENSLPFSSTLTTNGINNTYIAKLALSNLQTVEAANLSSYSADEIWSGSAILGDSVYVASNDTINKLFNGYTFDLNNMASDLAAEQVENMYFNSMSSNNTRMASIAVGLNADGTASLLVNVNRLANQSGINDVIDNSLTFYPNPVKDIMTLSKVSDINIYTLSGQLVAQAVNAKEINLKALTSGSYILTAKNMDGVQRLQFIKE